MPQRSRSPRRFWALVAAFVALAPPFSARAESPVADGVSFVTSAAFTYLPGNLTIDAGDHVIYTNLDPAAGVEGHSLTHAVADPLFWTPVMIVGGTADVTGIPELAPGAYPFACEVHPEMTGTLTVR